MGDQDEHEPVEDDHASEIDADTGTMSDHADPHPATDETPRRH